jgi:endonuclease YncB( thermonuclease family)
MGKSGMKQLSYVFCLALIVAGFIFSALNAHAQTGKQKDGVIYDAKITRVIDGDTVAFEATFLPDPLKKELSIRVFGVDTPEKGFRAKCAKEDVMGQKASDFTKKAVVSTKHHQVILMDWDKYGGRVLGDVILDGKSLRQALITNGLAREYYGEAKTSWCE